MNNNSKKTLVISVCIIIIAGFICFFCGKYVSDSAYKAERENWIKIALSDMEGLGEIDGTIYVTGHKSPDADTVGSCIGYAYLLNQLGYDATPVVLGRVNNETKYVLEVAGLEEPALLEDASGLNMILVDHSEYTQSADGLKDSNIVSIIDHHADGSITTPGLMIYDARPLGSTATIIWIRYYNYGVTPDKATATAMMGSILSDTKNLKSSNTTYADKQAVEELSKIAEITDVDTFFEGMFQASLSYEGMTDLEIFFNDYKEYESGGITYSIGNVNAYDEEAATELALRMIDTFPAALQQSGMDMAFIQVNALHDDVSFTYIIPSDETANEVLQTAFGDTATYTGQWYVLDSYASRKKIVVPAITQVLEAYPKE